MKAVTESKNFTIYQWDDPNYMFFEHNELGDECGGGLWFDRGILTDYDGVWMLPKEVAMALKDIGLDVSYVEGDYD